MKKNDIDRILRNEINKKLKSLAFNKKGYYYVREYNTFKIKVIVPSVADYYSFFITSFAINLTNKKYDKIKHIINGKKVEDITVLNMNQGDLYDQGKYYIPEYRLEIENDVYRMIDELIHYLKNEALPYLESINNIEALDKIINENPTEPTAGVKGLILAKMSDNPNYEELKKKYRQLFIDRQWAIQEDIDNLEKVILFLDNHSKEELEKIAKDN